MSDQRSNSANEPDELDYLQTTPVDVIIGNHLFVLMQLATLRLVATPPDLTSAALVIDVVAAIVQGAGDRLGEHAELYRNALAEVQQVYVRASTSGS